MGGEYGSETEAQLEAARVTRLEVEKAVAAERAEIAFDIAENPNNEWTKDLCARLAEMTAERDKKESQVRELLDGGKQQDERIVELSGQLTDVEAERDRMREALKNVWQQTPCNCRWDFQRNERTYVCEACEVYEAALTSSRSGQGEEA